MLIVILSQEATYLFLSGYSSNFGVIDLFTGNKLMFIGIIFLRFGSRSIAMSYYNDLKHLMTIFVLFQTTQIVSLIPRNSPTDRLMLKPK